MATRQAVILGLGNILCGDDGFGVHCVQMLAEGWKFADCCEVIDGGTQGQLLCGIVEETRLLLIIDAVDFGLAPATLTILGREAIPSWLAKAKLGAHQCSFAETLALARLRDRTPDDIRLIGFQAVNVEFGASLSPAAREALPEAMTMAIACLSEWGIACEPCKSAPQYAAAELRRVFLDRGLP